MCGGAVSGARLGPVRHGAPQPDFNLLRPLAVDHERAHRAPRARHEGVRDQYDRPPPAPEEIEYHVVVAVLGAKEENGDGDGKNPAGEIPVEALGPARIIWLISGNFQGFIRVFFGVCAEEAWFGVGRVGVWVGGG